MSDQSQNNNSEKDMNWGRRLANVLKEKAISQKQAARAVKVSPSVLNGWLAGASPNNFNKVKQLADYLGVSFTWLLTGESDGNKHHPSLEDLFEAEPFFQGNVKITIEKLLPKAKRKNEGDL